MKTILVVEDDNLQAQWIRERLQEAFPDASVLTVKTESEFRQRFNEIAESEPDVVVMDVMLRWADPRPDFVDPPENVRAEGFYRAGLRCEGMLAGDSRTAKTPVILYTVLERADLKDEFLQLSDLVQYLPKQPELEPLVQKIKEVTHQQRATSGQSRELLESI